MQILMMTDGYKLGHHKMYPKGTKLVFSNLTPRSNKYAPHIDGVVVMLQPMIYSIHEMFHEFFTNPFDGQIEETLSNYLGAHYDISHFKALHQLGYLPIEFRCLEDGTLCPIGVPMMTMHNTHPNFYWLPNYLETIISLLAWKACTSASIARKFRQLTDTWVTKTDPERDFLVPYMMHDFSMRGMDSIYAASVSALAHSLYFDGSDSLPAFLATPKWYNTASAIKSVNATEHSVMSAGIGVYGEYETYKQLIKDFPYGILSIVSDTMDLWAVLTEILPKLKADIMARNGKVVIRPDSGNPVDIICGNKEALDSEGFSYNEELPEFKGVIELLWDIFGGTINEQGYKVLDSHIGAIYGDSITYERAEQIYKRLEAKGFAATNIVLGVGSYTYQFNSRDTLGFAVKATYCEVIKPEVNEYDGEDPRPYYIEGVNIFKDPVTDDGTKKSAKGLLAVMADETGKLVLHQEVEWVTVKHVKNLLKRYNPITFAQAKINACKNL